MNKSPLQNNGKKVALAISGGIDSAVSAHLLKQQGYKLSCFHFKLYCEDEKLIKKRLNSAKKIANFLSLPLKIIDLYDQHKKEVVNDFIKQYKSGLCPNPCVTCNKKVKFGAFYDYALKNGFDYISTGHYARILKKNSFWYLATPADIKKDQTYFLHGLKEKQLNNILFPLGDLQKTEVKKIATRNKLPVSLSESSGICFIKDKKTQNFLQQHIKKNPGQVVDKGGSVVGTHQGINFYSIGQRQCFYINAKLLSQKTTLTKDKHSAPPLYVIGKNIKKNQLIVGSEKQAYKNNLLIKKLSFITSSKGEGIVKERNLFIKIRHTGKKTACSAQKKDENFIIKFKEPQFAITPGQSAVLYQLMNKKKQEYVCLGGGEIISSPKAINHPGV